MSQGAGLADGVITLVRRYGATTHKLLDFYVESQGISQLSPAEAFDLEYKGRVLCALGEALKKRGELSLSKGGDAQ